MSENAAVEKSFGFALRIVRLYKFLCDEKKEFVLSKETLHCGTNIGAHIKSAQEAESRPSFMREISLALHFASRTEYWLQLLHQAEYLDERMYESIHADCLELIRLCKAISEPADPRR